MNTKATPLTFFILINLICLTVVQGITLISENPARGTIRTFGPSVTIEEMETVVNATVEVEPVIKGGVLYEVILKGGTITLEKPSQGLTTANSYESLEFDVSPIELDVYAYPEQGQEIQSYHMREEITLELVRGTAMLEDQGDRHFYSFASVPQEANLKVKLFHVTIENDEIVSAMFVFPKGDDITQMIMSDPNDGTSIERGMALCTNPVTMLAVETEPPAPADSLLFASDAELWDEFGSDVAISGNVAVVGAEDEGDTGAAYVFRLDGENWIQETILRPQYFVSNIKFGRAVAADNDVIVVGAEFAFNTGAVFIYRYNGITWIEEDMLQPEGVELGSKFGISVAVSNDLLLVGAPNAAGGGQVYSFRFNGSWWWQDDNLNPLESDRDGNFGASVSLTGNHALVGNPYSELNGRKSGSVYYFKFEYSNWNDPVLILPEDNGAWDQFGASVSIGYDWALIGSPGPAQVNGGAAYLYKVEENGLAEYDLIRASDGSGGSQFGYSVSIGEDVALIGAPASDMVTGTTAYDVGAVYAYNFNAGNWRNEIKLTKEEANAYDYFGRSVSVDQLTGLIGIPGDDEKGDKAGAAVSVYLGNSGEDPEEPPVALTLHEVNKLPGYLQTDAQRFGSSISIAGDWAVVGGPANPAGYEGAAYVFHFDGNAWNMAAELKAPLPEEDDLFGYAVSISGDQIYVGAPMGDGNEVDTGCVYLYRFDGDSWNYEVQLSSIDGEAGDNFGQSLAAEGSSVLIGAPGADYGGAVFTYTSSALDGAWLSQTVPTPTDLSSNAGFGTSVSMHNGNILIGAPMQDGFGGKNAGTAYYYTPTTSSYFLAEELVPNDANKWEFFGWSVDLKESGAIVGSPGYGPNGGSAYLFAIDSAANLSEVDKVFPSDWASGNFFGLSVSWSGDNILVGAPGDDRVAPDAGALYVYTTETGEADNESKLMLDASDAYNQMGLSVDADGSNGMVGVPGYRNGNHKNVGNVFSLILP